MATAADLAGVATPTGLDSVSFAPTLFGEKLMQRQHDYLYWEFYEKGISQAVLLDGRWKAIRLGRVDAPIQLFDLTTDLAEQHDVAAQHPDVVSRAAATLQSAHVDNEFWKIPAAATSTPTTTK
jgi:arylsulfatase A-like enzyme